MCHTVERRLVQVLIDDEIGRAACDALATRAVAMGDEHGTFLPKPGGSFSRGIGQDRSQGTESLPMPRYSPASSTRATLTQYSARAKINFTGEGKLLL